MTIQETIKEAIKGGWHKPYDHLYPPFGTGPCLDPDFWKALGKSLEWCEGEEDNNGCINCQFSNCENNWLFHWHSFIDFLAENNKAEDFFKKLN